MLFQSSPARRAGAALAVKAISTSLVSILARPKGGRSAELGTGYRTCRFNPRPPEGRALQGRPDYDDARVVSILARPKGGRYLIQRPILLVHHRVSILARPEGRALPSEAKTFNRTLCFNPRPPRGQGGCRVLRSPLSVGPSRFQSSPAPKRGRCNREGRGRYSSVTLLFSRLVSILARAEARALQCI